MEILSHDAGKWSIQMSKEHWIISAFYITDQNHVSISVHGSQEIWDLICQMDENSFTNFMHGCI